MTGADRPQAIAAPPGRLALFALLGVCAGLPFYLFSTVLSLRLAQNGVPIAVIGFFAWVSLLPTFKFLWAPIVDRFGVPGFARFYGRRRSWILAGQLGIAASITGLALTHPDRSLTATAFWALALAFWTTMLEIAVDGWRIELAPDAATQGPIVAANIWGYRGAMVAVGSGVLLVAERAGWAAGYLIPAAVALAAFVPIAATRRDAAGEGGRVPALAKGLAASAALFAGLALVIAIAGSALLALAAAIGIGANSNVTPWLLGLALVPFLAMALAIPAIRRRSPEAIAASGAPMRPYLDLFWRYGFAAITLLAFVSLYRMGDVLALTLAKPFVAALGYSLGAIGLADGIVALAASMAGVAAGGLLAARWPAGSTLALGALLAAIGNFAFVWLGARPLSAPALWLATGADQFGNGFAGAAFVVYLSLLVNPVHAAAQYAFLSGFAFLLPRLLAGGAGSFAAAHGYSAFFLMAGTLSLAALLFLPPVLRARPREGVA
ncbi:permease [Sphingomonas spermidinifaciens]|uniref:Permease n=1 Tax=Sphingomonas spermidinifaciens TaxID=1141889 RepID=A0A2A4B7X6_9SPHN|nr:permease [Sphingomonas spermidinifaciens]PCD04187.1 permease [Sphingomonas spermidinifaciens]